MTPGERKIAIAPGSGMDKARRCTCWPKPDDARPCTPQTCDWRCLAYHVHGRPFYSHGDLQYLEHGTGPLAAELDRLWRAKGTMKGGAARDAAAHDGGGWRALPRGAAGLAPDRPHLRPVTELYYRGLQDPPPGHDGRNAGSGRWLEVSVAGSLTCLAGLRRAVRTSLQQLPAAIPGEVVDELALASARPSPTPSCVGSCNIQPAKVAVGCKAAGSRRRSATAPPPPPTPLP